MLKAIRKKGFAKGVFSILVISLLISVFIFWGTATRNTNTRRSQYIGVIFNKNIEGRTFDESLKTSYILAKLRFGEDFYKLKDVINLEAQAWDRLVILEAALRQRINVVDTQLINYIKAFPLFQSKEGFSLRLYELITQNLGMSKKEFEEMMRQQLAIETFYAQITKDVSVTDQEILDDYKQMNETANLDIISILPVDYQDKVSVSVEEAKQYYQEHTENFKEPDKVNVQYIGIGYPEDATEDKKSEINKSLDGLYQKIIKAKNISEVAQEYSLQVKETGFFAINEPIPNLGWSPEFTKEAFFIMPDSFSKPVATLRGCYILKLKEKKPTHIPEFEQSQDKVTDVLKTEKARSLAKDETSKYRQEIEGMLNKNPKLSLKEIAEKLKLKYSNKEDFKRDDYLPGVGFSKQAQEFAFDLTKEEISDVIESPTGFYILKRAEFKGVDEKKFAEEKDKIKERFLQQKKDTAFSEYVEKELKPKTSLFIKLDKDENLLY